MNFGTEQASLPDKAFGFQLQARQNHARSGVLQTPHGMVNTPVFMPVGTHSAVKMLTLDQVEALGAQIILGNAYHLSLRPGARLIEQAGGLHGWMNWQKPVLTDSGGFQVFSLSNIRQITDDGVWFQDPVDGQKHFIGPKESIAIQNALGADIIMAFDDCPPYPVSEAQAAASLQKTHRWLEACWQAHQNPKTQALFPIVQGSTYKPLRQQAVDFVTQFDAVGYAMGGVSVGESKTWVKDIVAFTAPLLPEHKPRYLMGVGTPEDLLEGIRAGIDMFDCVMPTRIARHGSFFTLQGRRIIRNAEFTDDFTPLAENCGCYTCQTHSRAYIRHLYRQKEATASTLLSIHNIYTLVWLAGQAREKIIAGQFEDFYAQTMLGLQGHKNKV